MGPLTGLSVNWIHIPWTSLDKPTQALAQWGSKIRWPRQHVRKGLDFGNDLNPSNAKDAKGVQGSSVDDRHQHKNHLSKVWNPLAPHSTNGQHCRTPQLATSCWPSKLSSNGVNCIYNNAWACRTGSWWPTSHTPVCVSQVHYSAGCQLPLTLRSQVLIRSYILYYLLEMFVHMKLNMGFNHAIIDVHISSEYLQMSWLNAFVLGESFSLSIKYLATEWL